jgi:hypothetical protein
LKAEQERERQQKAEREQQQQKELASNYVPTAEILDKGIADHVTGGVDTSSRAFIEADPTTLTKLEVCASHSHIIHDSIQLIVVDKLSVFKDRTLGQEHPKGFWR